MLKNRLKTVRDRFFEKSNVRFARAVGVSEGSVRGWVRGDHLPNADAMERIRRAAGVSSKWLLAGEGPMETATDNIRSAQLNIVDAKAAWFRGARERIDAYYPVPLVAGGIAAGSPREISEYDVEDWIPTIFHRDWCPHPEQTVCVRVAGDSMIPTIPDGGLVAIDLAQKDPARLVGRIVALRREGGVTVKRLFRTDEGVFVARPDNVSSNEIFVYQRERISEAILGKIVWWWGRSD
jgi:phage repressor protein C with HTH and peptisase S24 domain